MNRSRPAQADSPNRIEEVPRWSDFHEAFRAWFLAWLS
jgi:hypothetical protein